MTLQHDAFIAGPASLPTSELVAVQRLWDIAGLPPVSGYGTALLSTAVASDPTLVGMLPSVDFDDSGSVSDAVEVLLEWRQRTFG